MPRLATDEFVKSHGLGNDYIVLDEQALSFPLFSASLPSGLKIRTPKSAPFPGTTSRIPSDPTP